MKKPVLIFTCADTNNFSYAVLMVNSLTKFHSPQDIDIVLFTNETREEELKKLPEGIQLRDLTPYLQDTMFFYRQKPIIMEEYIKEYELVIGLDSDQIICGDLNYLFETKDYDVATVMNWNRQDPNLYGYVQGWGINPMEYMNCGLVAVRSEKFVHHWNVLCFTPQFDRLQYKEQDILNILVYYGNYNVRCLDHGDGLADMAAWWGIISKGELLRAKIDGDHIYIPKGFGDTPFPHRDIDLKIIHSGGGNMPNKMNYRTWFEDEQIIERINYLVSGK